MKLGFVDVVFREFIYFWHHYCDREMEVVSDIIIHIYICLLWTNFCITDKNHLLDSMRFFLEIPRNKRIEVFSMLLSHFGKPISWKIRKMIFSIYKKYICCPGFPWLWWSFYKVFFVHKCIHQTRFSYIWPSYKYHFISGFKKYFCIVDRNWFHKLCGANFHNNWSMGKFVPYPTKKANFRKI